MHAGRERSTRFDGRRSGKLGICAVLSCLAAHSAAISCAIDQITLRDGESEARFRIEVADDPAERAQGLMFRESMSLGAGMLFVYDEPQPVAFWMENTLIPLDMIFIGADGTVTSIHENAIPGDRSSIFGGEAIQFVLEINGGLARRLGIGEGAQVQHPAVPQESAVFPCE